MKPQSTTPTSASATENKPLFSPKTSGKAFTFAVVASLVASFVFSIALSAVKDVEAFSKTNAYVFIAYLLPQIGLIVTVFLLWKTSGASFSNFLPTQKSGAISYLFAFGVLFGLVFGFGWLNTLFLRLLEKIGYEPPQSVLPNLSNFGTYLLAVVVIACLPAFGEELLFRGAMTAGLKGESLFKSVLLCGVCFSVFHQNPAQTPYQLLCGAVFALILFQTENLLLTLFMHFINNFYIITATYLQIPAFSAEWQIALAALGIAVFAVSIGYFLTRKPPKKQQSGSLKPFLLYALPGLVICITLWVYNFMKGMVS